MLFYDLKSGMHPRRVRILLAEKGVQIPSRQVDVVARENDSVAFRRLNPLGKLPVLELDDGTVLAESIAICRYLEFLYPTPALFGSTYLEKAQVEMWMRRVEYGVVQPILNVFLHASDFYKDRVQQLPAYAEWSRLRAAEGMAWLEAELADKPHIGGEPYTMADIMAQCAFVLGKAAGIRIPAELTQLTRWYEAVSARPSARA